MAEENKAVVAPYIPPTSSGLDGFAANFSTLISAAPATYGLTAGDATAIATATALYHAAYLLGGTLAGGHTPRHPWFPNTCHRRRHEVPAGRARAAPPDLRKPNSP